MKTLVEQLSHSFSFGFLVLPEVFGGLENVDNAVSSC